MITPARPSLPGRSAGRHISSAELAVAVLALCAIVGIAFGQTLESTITLPDSLCGLTSATCAVYNPADNRVYVGGRGRYLLVIDGYALQKVARIDMPDSVTAMTLDSAGTKIYAINATSRSISVVDLVGDSVRAVVPVGRSPTALCYSARLQRLFCTDYLDRLVYVIDCTIDSVVAAVPAGYGSVALCLDTTGSKLYCANQRSNDLSVIDAAGDSLLKTISAGSYPQALCCNTNRNKIYCLNNRGRNVAVIDAGKDSILALPFTGNNYDNICYNSADDKVYCGGAEAEELTIISGDCDTVLTRLRAAGWSKSLLYNPLNDRVYCGRSSEVVILEGATDSVRSTLPVQNEYYILARQANPNRVWCAGEQALILDANADTVEASVAIGCRPQSICYSVASGKLYVGYELGMRGEVAAIDAATGRILRRISVPYLGPVLCYNAAVNKVYTGGPKLSVISCASDAVIDSIPVQGYSEGRLCSNPDASKMYFSSVEYPYLAVIDAIADTVTRWLWLGSGSRGLCYNSANRCAYVHLDDSSALGAVVAVDGDRDSTVASVRTNMHCGGPLLLDPLNNVLYDADMMNGDVVLIDCDSIRMMRRLRLRGQPTAMCYNTHDNRVYVANWSSGNLWVIDGTTSRLDSVPIGQAMGDVFYNPLSNNVFCAGGATYVIDGTTNIVTDSFPATMDISVDQPSFALDPQRNRVFALDYGASRVLVIRDTWVVGVAEMAGPTLRTDVPTIVHGSLRLPEQPTEPHGEHFTLTDVSGRRVADIETGPNDLRHLAPGVYFLRSGRGLDAYRFVLTR